ncbi:uncharacterized protein LOC130821458 [Amaranthus tricolor]|uniref:uncharacterized protein LOC130821458 n=1 Tax=Amaranthus tricolor TaxID=29722 RepID=UPI00258E5371|nr:uncharacterized protein LOC130821458 [Amaranthus tricolor]
MKDDQKSENKTHSYPHLTDIPLPHFFLHPHHLLPLNSQSLSSLFSHVPLPSPTAPAQPSPATSSTTNSNHFSSSLYCWRRHHRGTFLVIVGKRTSLLEALLLVTDRIRSGIIGLAMLMRVLRMSF